MKVKEKVQQVSVKGILCRNNKVLVLKTASRGNYELPGGRVDFGETIEEAFKREMKEELGFENVRMGKFINVWTFLHDRKEAHYHFMILDFEIFSDEKEIKISTEHTDYKWIDANEIDAVNMRDGHKESLRKFFKNQSTEANS